MKMFCMFLLLMLMEIEVIGGEVKAKFGEVTVHGFNKYTIETSNGKVTMTNLHGGEEALDGMHFGLVKWECDTNDKGSLVSYVECIPCGSFCTFNQQFYKCKNVWFAPIIGLATALFIMLLILLMLVTCLRATIMGKILNIIAYIMTKSDKRRAKKIYRLNKMTGRNQQVRFKDINVNCPKLKGKIVNIRLGLRKMVNNDEPTYGEITYQDKSKPYETINMIAYSKNKVRMNNEKWPKNEVIIKTKGPEVPPRRLSSRSTSSNSSVGATAAKAVVTAALMSSMVSPVYTCDKNLYLTSTGKICTTGNRCYDTNSY
jgi:hypothetical protein